MELKRGGIRLYRGTTPKQIFNLGFLLENEEEIYVTYAQGGAVVFEKELSEIEKIIDIDTGNTVLTFTLSQNETLTLKDDYIDIQIRIKYLDGTAIASDLIRTYTSIILKDGEI